MRIVVVACAAIVLIPGSQAPASAQNKIRKAQTKGEDSG